MHIIYTNIDGTVSVLIPTDEALETMTLEEIAIKDVPEGVEWRVVDKLPQSRNWRGAWVGDTDVDIDLERAKVEHKKLMFAQCYPRLPLGLSGQPKKSDVEQLEADIEAMDFSGVTSLQELYNTWISEFDGRSKEREYNMYGLS